MSYQSCVTYIMVYFFFIYPRVEYDLDRLRIATARGHYEMYTHKMGPLPAVNFFTLLWHRSWLKSNTVTGQDFQIEERIIN
jgi:hypothetical protein